MSQSRSHAGYHRASPPRLKAHLPSAAFTKMGVWLPFFTPPIEGRTSHLPPSQKWVSGCRSPRLKAHLPSAAFTKMGVWLPFLLVAAPKMGVWLLPPKWVSGCRPPCCAGPPNSPHLQKAGNGRGRQMPHISPAAHIAACLVIVSVRRQSEPCEWPVGQSPQGDGWRRRIRGGASPGKAAWLTLRPLGGAVVRWTSRLPGWRHGNSYARADSNGVWLPPICRPGV